MRYKKCSHCATITDEDEKICPNCGQNPFLEEKIDLSKLISLLNSGKITAKKIWVKNPIIIIAAKN